MVCSQTYVRNKSELGRLYIEKCSCYVNIEFNQYRVVLILKKGTPFFISLPNRETKVSNFNPDAVSLVKLINRGGDSSCCVYKIYIFPSTFFTESKISAKWQPFLLFRLNLWIISRIFYVTQQLYFLYFLLQQEIRTK